MHVYNASGFDLVALNFKVKFFPRNFEDFGGFRHDLRSDHDMLKSEKDFQTTLSQPSRGRFGCGLVQIAGFFMNIIFVFFK